MHPKDMTLLLLLLLYSAVYTRHIIPRLSIPRYVYIMTILIVLPLPIAWLGGAAVPEFATQQTIHLLAIFLFAIIFWDTARRSHQDHRLIEALIFASTAAAGLGILQYIGFIDVLFPPIPGYTQKIYSVFGNQDLLGGFTALGTALALNRWLIDKEKSSWKWAIALPILFIALGLTGSRSAWLAFVMATLLTIPYREINKVRMVAITGVGAGMLLALLVITPETTLHRFTSTFSQSDTGGHLRLWFWAGSALMWKDHFLLGVGPGNFSFYSPSYLGEALRQWPDISFHYNTIHTLHAHSDFMEIAIERGLLGISMLIAAAWFIKRHTARHVWPGLAALLVFSLLNTTLHSTPHVFAAALLVMAGTSPNISKPFPQYVIMPRFVPIIIAVIIGLTHLYITILPEYRLQTARHAYVQEENPILIYTSLTQNRWSSPYASLELAALLLEEGELEKGREMADKALKRLDTGEIHYLAGEIAYREGRTAQAASHFKACTHRWPGYMPAWLRRADLASPTEIDAILEEARPFLTSDAFRELQIYKGAASPL